MALVDGLSHHHAFVGHQLNDRHRFIWEVRLHKALKLVRCQDLHGQRLSARTSNAISVAIASRGPPTDRRSRVITLEQAEVGVAQIQDVLTQVQLGLDTADRVQREVGKVSRVVLAVFVAAGVGAIVVAGLTAWRRRKAARPPIAQ